MLIVLYISTATANVYADADADVDADAKLIESKSFHCRSREVQPGTEDAIAIGLIC